MYAGIGKGNRWTHNTVPDTSADNGSCFQAQLGAMRYRKAKPMDKSFLTRTRADILDPKRFREVSLQDAGILS